MNIEQTVALMRRAGITQEKIKTFLDSQPVMKPITESKNIEKSIVLESMSKTELESLLTQRQMEKYGYTKFAGSRFNPDDKAYSIEEHLSHPLVKKRLSEVKWSAQPTPPYPGSYFTKDVNPPKDPLSDKLAAIDDKADIEHAKKVAKAFLQKSKVTNEVVDEEFDLENFLGQMKEIAFPDGQSPDEKKKKLPISGGNEETPKKIDINKKIEIPDDKMLEPGWDKDIDDTVEEMSGTGAVSGYNTIKAWSAPGQTTNGGIEASKKLGFSVAEVRKQIQKLKEDRPIRNQLMAALENTIEEMGLSVSNDAKEKLFDELYNEVIISKPKKVKSGIQEDELDETKSPNFYGRNKGKKYTHHQVDSTKSAEKEKEKE